MDETIAEYNASSEGSDNRILVVNTLPSQFDSLANHLKAEKRGENFEWKIDNKYYSVSVILVSIHSNQLKKALESGEFGGIVLLFDGDNEFEKEIKPWAKYIEEKDPPVCLCLPLKGESKNSKEEDKLHVKYNDWCVDNGIEFVGPFGLESNEGEEDEEDLYGKGKYGMDRIVEALESNMWPGMVYKSQQRPTSSKTAESFGDEIEEFTSAITATVNQLNVDDKLQSSENNKESKSQPKKSENSTQKEKETIFNKNENKKEIEEEMKRRAHSFFKEVEMMEEEIDDGDEMKQLQSFEKALQQLNAVRNNAKNLSDKDRREMAARVALSFLSEMGEEESDSDED
eukprot:TRINITY_DN3059_c0_g1_i1.p1 TRINITY_DN3059_c0_g1~~TRINITY_DN3059_c0_g1_i1.p1  ORF type:complete len:343 (-),score=154.74 TRINITY_DN3059_c0_g1_i1:111-1139(-)